MELVRPTLYCASPALYDYSAFSDDCPVRLFFRLNDKGFNTKREKSTSKKPARYAMQYALKADEED